MWMVIPLKVIASIFNEYFLSVAEKTLPQVKNTTTITNNNNNNNNNIIIIINKKQNKLCVLSLRATISTNLLPFACKVIAYFCG
jgi:hypothetical protein